MVSRKKISILLLSTLLTLTIVFVALSFLYKKNVTVYKAPESSLFLAASFQAKNKENLAEWEKEIIDRKSTASLDRSSYTESIARSALAEYFKVKNANAAIDEEEIARQVIQNSAIADLQREIEFKEYQLSDLHIISSNDKQSIKKYGNDLGEAATKNVYDNTNGNEFEIFSRVIQFGDTKDFDKLKPIIENYEKLVKNLIDLEVPSNIAPIHLKIINSLSAMRGSTQEFNVFLTDPLRGFFVLSKYAKYGSDLRNNLKEIDVLMKKNGINFINTDYGYVIEKAANTSLPN